MPRYPVEPAWETIVTQLYEASVGNHVETVRWTYTVPAGRFAVVQMTLVVVGTSAAADQLAAFIVINSAGGTRLGYVVRVSSLTTRAEIVLAHPHLVLDAGQILQARTVNSDAVVRAFILSAHIVEVVK